MSMSNYNFNSLITGSHGIIEVDHGVRERPSRVPELNVIVCINYEGSIFSEEPEKG